MKQNTKLVFVYNTDSSVFAQLKDYVHKTVSPKTYRCNLCGLTYSGVSMKDEWKDFINSLPIKAEFLHKDEFIRKYPSMQNSIFPTAFVKEDNSLRQLISTQEINQQESLEDLKVLVRERVANH